MIEESVCFQESEAWIFAVCLRNTTWVLSMSSHAHFCYLMERENLAFKHKKDKREWLQTDTGFGVRIWKLVVLKNNLDPRFLSLTQSLSLCPYFVP